MICQPTREGYTSMQPTAGFAEPCSGCSLRGHDQNLVSVDLTWYRERMCDRQQPACFRVTIARQAARGGETGAVAAWARIWHTTDYKRVPLAP